MSKSPIFPLPEPQHFSDYGFDPQIDYFQVLEEARRHTKRGSADLLDSLRFKLQKPISKDDHRSKSKHKRRHRWWRSASAALLFWKRPKSSPAGAGAGDEFFEGHPQLGLSAVPSSYSYPHYRPVSGPVYATEIAGSGRGTPCRTSRPSSGPLMAAEVAGIPYVSLRDLNRADDHLSSGAAAPMPIYLVT